MARLGTTLGACYASSSRSNFWTLPDTRFTRNGEGRGRRRAGPVTVGIRSDLRSPGSSSDNADLLAPWEGAAKPVFAAMEGPMLVEQALERAERLRALYAFNRAVVWVQHRSCGTIAGVRWHRNLVSRVIGRAEQTVCLGAAPPLVYRVRCLAAHEGKEDGPSAGPARDRAPKRRGCMPSAAQCLSGPPCTPMIR